MRKIKISMILYLIVTVILSSCNDKTIQREVFLGFNLGSSMSETEKKFDELYNKRQIERCYDKTPFLIHNLPNGKNYYSVPFYYVPPGDTIVTQFKLIYGTQGISEISQINNNIREGRKFYNLSSQELSNVSSDILKNDIVENLIKKYSNYSRVDTFDFHQFDENSSRKKIVYYWDDKQGVNINLEYDIIGPPNDYSGNSCIILEYRLTDDILNMIPRTKGIY